MSDRSKAALDELRERLRKLEQGGRVPTKRYVNMSEAAAFLGKSREWLPRRLLAGTGPQGRRRGRQWQFRIEDLDAFAESTD